MSLLISKNNSPTYDYYSTGDGSDPAAVSVATDGGGGTVDSDTITAYLVATDNNYKNITVQPSGEDTGIDWKVSLNGSTWTDSVSPSDMDATSSDQVTTIYLKAVADNDGSLSPGVLTGCDIDITYDEYAV